LKIDGNRIAEHAKYCQSMMDLLAQRAERYAEHVTELGYKPIAGIGIEKSISATGIERMIVQLRAELLELERMI